jgi:hypothetical protein
LIEPSGLPSLKPQNRGGGTTRAVSLLFLLSCGAKMSTSGFGMLAENLQLGTITISGSPNFSMICGTTGYASLYYYRCCVYSFSEASYDLTEYLPIS